MAIGSHIGQYKIVREIGAGGMGTVFLAEHRLLGRRAAIKTLQPSLSVHQEIVERFFNEARATSSIADPGVIQIFDFGYHVDGTAYIVMELLEGEALSGRIARLGRLPVGLALRIARQCAGALAAAHAREIVHRDLKPENVFLVRDPEAQGGERAKILDFGICKVGSSDAALTLVGSTFGTPAYMSPEQCRGAGQVDHRSDIYSFGCLLYHMLVGHPPFPDEAPGEVIAAHLRELAPVPSDSVPELAPAVDVLVGRCLEKSPEERFQSMAELQVALGRLHGELGLPVGSEPPPAPTLPKAIKPQIEIVEDDELDLLVIPPARSRRGKLAILGLLAVATAAMVAVATASDRTEPTTPTANRPALVSPAAAPAPVPAPAPAAAPPKPVAKPAIRPAVKRPSPRRAPSTEDLYETR